LEDPFPEPPMPAPLADVHLHRMDLPGHACPWGLRAVKLLQQQHIPFEDHRLTSQEEVEAFKEAHGVATTPQIFSGSDRIGGTTALAARLGVRLERDEISYTPVVAVFVTAGLMALVMSAGVRGFMGIAICLLAMLKLMDVAAFAASFRNYDLLSQRWRSWGRLYPGVELLVGLGMLLAPQSPAVATLVGAAAVGLGALGMEPGARRLPRSAGLPLQQRVPCANGGRRSPTGQEVASWDPSPDLVPSWPG
jgi:glutaredoxin